MRKIYKKSEMENMLRDRGIENPETFCLAPYMNADLDQSGAVYTCYRGKTRLGDWKDSPFSGVFNNEKMENIRQELYDGVKHKNCQSCYLAEDNGSYSPRMNFFNRVTIPDHYQDTPQFYERWEKLIQDIIKNPKQGRISDITRAEMRPSSLCNQRCMHCSPESSTKWVETMSKQENWDQVVNEIEVHTPKNHQRAVLGLISESGRDIPAKHIPKFYKKSLTGETPYKQDVLDVMESSEEVSFTGGEPLIAPDHLDYLKFMCKENAYQKTLSYSTNLNGKDIEKYFPYWDQFHQLTFRISIDSDLAGYEYFRTYGNVDLLKENLEKLINFGKGHGNTDISGTITFNMFAALRWKSILADWSRYNLDFHSSLVLQHPVSVKWLPKTLSNQALEEMQWCIDNLHTFGINEDYQERVIHFTNDCMNYIKGFNNEFDTMPERTKQYIIFSDKTSGNDYKNYYPELIPYMK